MADVQRIIEIVFQGDDKITKTIQSVEARLGQFKGKIQDVADPLAGFATGVLKIEAALGALVVGGLALSVNAAGKFGDSFAEISTLTDATASDLDALKSSILDYSRQSTQSLESINGAVYSAISAGTDYKDSLELLTTSERLAVAGKTDLNSATVLLASTLNAYGESTDQAARYSDVLFNTVRLGQTTVPELAQSLAQVTGVASAAGVPIETLSAAIAALTATGAPTAQAITGIKAALSNVIKPSSEAAKTAKDLGIAFDVQALKAKGLDGLLTDVQRATGGNVETMGKLFGSVEALNAVLVLAGDETGKFKGALDAMQSATGATEAAYEKMAQNVGLANQRLANNVNATLIQVGDKITDEYVDIAGALSDVFASIGESVESGAFDSLFQAIESLGDDIADTLREIAENLPEALGKVDFSGFVSSFRDLGQSVGGAFEAVFGQIDPSQPEDIARAIQRLVDAFEALNRISAGIFEGLTPFFELIGSALDNVDQLENGTYELVGQISGLGLGVSKLLSYTDGLGVFFGLFGLSSIVNAGATLGRVAGAMGVTTAASTALGAATSVLLSPGGLVAIAGVAGGVAGTLLNEFVPGVSKAAQSLIALSDEIFNFTGLKDFDDDSTNWNFDKAKEKYRDFLASQEEETKESATEQRLTFEQALAMVREKTVKIVAEPDIPSVKQSFLIIDEGLPTERRIAIAANTDMDKARDAQKKLDDEIPKSKIIEIEAQLKAESIKAQAAVIQTAIEWKAKLDIANVQANAEKIKAAFDSISVSIESTGTTMSSLVGSLGDEGIGTIQKWNIERLIQKEEERREKSFELQSKLVEQQIAEAKARAERYRQGGMNISFDASTLAPHLEAILWEILEAIQLRVNEDQGAYLLGA